MRNSIVLLGTLALVAACSRDRGPESGSTTVTGASTSEAKPVTVEEIRVAILDHNPTGPEALSSVVITSDNGVVTLKGTVPDEDSRANMVNRVKRMPNVKSVRDELSVAPKTGTMQGMPGQPGMTGQQPGMTGQQPGTIGQPQALPADEPSKGGTQTTTGSTKTKKTDAVRAGLTKDKAAPAAIVNGLVISDDGSVFILSGTVPDDKTHDAVLKSAKKSVGTEHVQDNLHVSGK